MQKSRLEQYGMLVAGAAGVALAGSAGAVVVTNAGNVTPGTSSGVGGTIALDLDNDGTIDINIVHSVGGGFYGNDAAQALSASVAGGSGFYVTNFASSAAALANASFGIGGGAYLADGSGFGGSQWGLLNPQQTGFVSLQFTSGAFGVVTGFVEVSVDTTTPGTTSAQFPTAPLNEPTVLSYGFENNIPEPGSLGLLALGAVGMMTRRKKSA